MYDHFLDECSVSRRSSVVDTGELLVTDSRVGRDIGKKFSSVRYLTADASNNVSVQVASEIRSIHALSDVHEFITKLSLVTRNLC